MSRFHYLAELPPESYAFVDHPADGGLPKVLIEEPTFAQIGDYTRSQPTSPSPGRVYRKNFGWPDDMPDNWVLHVCEIDPDDPRYVLHRPYRVEVVPS